MKRPTTFLGAFLLVAASACSADEPSAGPAPSTSGRPSGAAGVAETSLLERDGELRPGPAGTGGRVGFDLAVASNDRLVVELASTAFDPVLRVQLPDGSALSNDDYAGSRSESRLELASPQAGTMKVIVEAYSPEAGGAFHIRVRRVAPAPAPPVATASANLTAGRPATAAPAAGAQAATPVGGRSHHALPALLPSAAPIQRGRPLQGNLAVSSTLPSGEPMQVFVLSDVRAGQRLTVDVSSSAFDPYLLVQSPNGQLWENDDSGGTTASRVAFVASAPGDYRFVVSAYRAGMSGPFEIRASESASSGPAVSGTAPGLPARPAGPGRAIEGELAAGDQRLGSGELYDVHEITFAPGQRVDIEARSSDFDTYIIVLPPSGAQQENDDRAQGSTNAGLELVATVGGPHRIVVTSYRPEETGRYTLAIGTSAGAATTAPLDVATPSTPGAGRVYAILAGISDYPGGGNDLPECANDARKLSEALGRRGLLGEAQQIVLTDSQATRANLEAAFARAAREVRPDDVFLFFYSGHGAQGENGSRDAREIDGRDESIVLYDGNFVDDDLSRLLDTVRSRVSVAALDSCFSGGFSKDLITRPGRIGLFSSEEDVLSSVASQFQAGGYLSHFLRTGVGGDADASPADGVLTVGELTHFVYRQFAQHATDVQLQGAYQQLVVDRGAVPVDQVLWRYR